MPHQGRLITAVLLMVSVLLTVFDAAAQNPAALLTKSATAPKPSAGNSEQKAAEVDPNKLRDEVQAEIRSLDTSPGRQGDAPAGTPESELNERYRLLKLLAFTYQQHGNALNDRKEQEQRVEQLQKNSQSLLEGIDGQAYSVLKLDNLRADLQNKLLALHSLDAQIKIVDDQLDSVQTRLTKMQAHERQTLETLEKDSKREVVDRSRWLYRLAALESRTYAAGIDRLSAERKVHEVRRMAAELELENARKKLKAAEAKASFTEADMHAIRETIVGRRVERLKLIEKESAERDAAIESVHRLRTRQNSLAQQLTGLQADLENAQKDLTAAERELKTAEEQADGLLQKINPVRALAKRKAAENVRKANERISELKRRIADKRTEEQGAEYELKLAETQSQNAAIILTMSSNMLAGLEVQLAFWELRYAATGNGKNNAADLRKMQTESNMLLERIEPIIQHLQSQFELSIDLINQKERAKLGITDPAELKFLDRMLALLHERQQTYLKSLSRADELRQLLQRWQSEFESGGQIRKTDEKLRNWTQDARRWLVQAWDYELFAVEDTIEVDGRTITGKRGITVAKIIHAIAIIVIGYLIVSWLSAWIFRQAVQRMEMDATQANIARKWVVSISGAMLLLISLTVVKIPLTVFAFLGGAIALGAGFGMQTLFKNLISGLMLLIERPFRPGDIIEVGGIRGDIVDINVRSCTIRDVNGIETLIPNSTFIEQNVTNWTLSSRTVRFGIKVGVAYGTPLQEAIDLMLELAQMHPLVLKIPAPEVLLEDFGDNAQMLALYVWVEITVRSQPSRKTLSELRLAIAKAFAERNINISFPQRDIHLDTPQPIKIEVVKGA